MRILNNFLEHIGYYKKGLAGEGAIDPRDYTAEEVLGAAPTDLPRFVHLGGNADDQKRTNHCTAYATKKAKEIYEIDAAKDMGVFFEAFEQWKNQMIYPGTANEKSGDYIHSALKALKRFGLTFNGKKYSIDSYRFVPKEDWKARLAQGHPIITGFFCKTPLCDKTHTWRPTGSGGGHAILVIGYDDSKQRFILLNSWGSKWGKRGSFYVKYEDAPKMFRGWILYNSK